jgi:hypothetical protein
VGDRVQITAGYLSGRVGVVRDIREEPRITFPVTVESLGDTTFHRHSELTRVP